MLVVLVLAASCVWLFCDPIDFSLTGFFVHEISRQEYWSGSLFPSPKGSSQPRDQTEVSCIAGGFFTAEPPRKPPINVYTTKIDGTYETVHWDVWINVVDEVRMSQYGCDRGSLKKKMKSKEFLRKDLKSNTLG